MDHRRDLIVEEEDETVTPIRVPPVGLAVEVEKGVAVDATGREGIRSV